MSTAFSASPFAPEWGLGNNVRDKGSTARIVEVYREGKITHIFDEKGRKVLRSYPDKKTRQLVEFQMFYAPDGKLEKIVCHVDGKLFYTEKGSYADGLLRSLVRVDAEGRELCSTTMLIYDEKTSLLRSYGVQDKDVITDYFYDRNQRGEIVYIRAEVNKKFNTGARYTYDKNGLVAEVRSYNINMQNAGILRNEWKIDEHGNWIEKKSSLFNNLRIMPVYTETVKRLIEYRK